MILVVGASGRLGRLVAERLLERGQSIRVLDRGSASASDLAEAGAEVVPGDLKDRGSLLSACAGVDAIVTTANSALRGGADTVESVDRQGNFALIDAAVEAGATRFVFTSVLGASVHSPAPFVRAKGEVEERLRSTGLIWTVLQPNVFMDVWFPAVLGPALAGQSVKLVGQGRRRHSFVAAHDVASYAVSALLTGLADRQTLVIGGPQPMSWSEIIAMLEQQVGHPVKVEHLAPGDDLPHLPASMAELLTFMDTYDSPVDVTDLSRRHAVPPTPASAVIGNLVASDRQTQPSA
jgi:uncharacterized protein YbjT (DUF2867 family)